jgi:hypothetical protein
MCRGLFSNKSHLFLRRSLGGNSHGSKRVSTHIHELILDRDDDIRRTLALGPLSSELYARITGY